MICVSVYEPSIDECLSAIEGAQLAEVRLEHGAFGPAELERIFAQPVPIIATCRPGRMPDGERKKQLLAAIDAGAVYVDVEVDSAAAVRNEVISYARRSNCLVIVSFHDYQRTPPRLMLERSVERCEAAGADIVKVACWVQTPRDSARLLGLLDRERRMVVVGMGPHGRLVRLAAPILGSVFTFAARDDDRETAQGQMTRAEMEKAYQVLEAGP